MSLNFCILGTGEKALRLVIQIGRENVAAFIDLDMLDMEGKKQYKEEIPVIDINEYVVEFLEFPLVIGTSFLEEDRMKIFLIEKGIDSFFILSDCPGELQEPNSRLLLKNHLIKTYGKNYTDINIYGSTFYSVLVCMWMKENGNNVTLIPDKPFNKNLEEILRREFKIVDGLSVVNSGSVILNTRHYDAPRTETITPIYDIFDCSSVIEQYYNSDIEKYKGIHLGDRCFIVATGPSLRYEDLDTLMRYGETTISMNRIWLAYEKTKWKPNYYVVQDHRYIREDMDILDSLASEAVFVCDSDQGYLERRHPANHYVFHTQFEYPKKRLPKFSDDFSRKNYNGTTVTYTCLQLAAYMGFKDIYLLGVDFSDGNGNYSSVGNHFTPDYYKGKEHFPGFFGDSNLNAYCAAEKYSEEHGFRIMNATRGGYLEVFERVDFDQLFLEEH